MPFKSKAQQRYMFSQKPDIAHEWAEHTPDFKALPERVKKKKKRKSDMKNATPKEAFVPNPAQGVDLFPQMPAQTPPPIHPPGANSAPVAPQQPTPAPAAQAPAQAPQQQMQALQSFQHKPQPYQPIIQPQVPANNGVAPHMGLKHPGATPQTAGTSPAQSPLTAKVSEQIGVQMSWIDSLMAKKTAIYDHSPIPKPKKKEETVGKNVKPKSPSDKRFAKHSDSGLQRLLAMPGGVWNKTGPYATMPESLRKALIGGAFGAGTGGLLQLLTGDDESRAMDALEGASTGLTYGAAAGGGLGGLQDWQLNNLRRQTPGGMLEQLGEGVESLFKRGFVEAIALDHVQPFSIKKPPFIDLALKLAMSGQATIQTGGTDVQVPTGTAPQHLSQGELGNGCTPKSAKVTALDVLRAQQSSAKKKRKKKQPPTNSPVTTTEKVSRVGANTEKQAFGGIPTLLGAATGAASAPDDHRFGGAARGAGIGLGTELGMGAGALGGGALGGLLGLGLGAAPGMSPAAQAALGLGGAGAGSVLGMGAGGVGGYGLSKKLLWPKERYEEERKNQRLEELIEAYPQLFGQNQPQ